MDLHQQSIQQKKSETTNRTNNSKQRHKFSHNIHINLIKESRIKFQTNSHALILYFDNVKFY